MKCPRCGFNNGNGFAFCRNCGAPLRRGGVGKELKILIVVLVGIIVALLLALSIGVGVYVYNENTEKAEVHNTAVAVQETEAPAATELPQTEKPIETAVPAETAKPQTPKPSNAEIKKSKYLQTAGEIEIYEEKVYSGSLSQHELNRESGVVLEKWDGLLNEVYQYLKSTMNDDEFSRLKKDEIQWIKERDAAVEEAAKDWEGGSGEPMVRNGTASEYTKDRCYYLISLIK